MSVKVAPAELAGPARERGQAAFVLTTNAEGRIHVGHHEVRVDGAVVRCRPGGSALRNVVAGSAVVVVWPAGPDGFSLIADGTGEAEAGDVLAVHVTDAVKHRPPPPWEPA